MKIQKYISTLVVLIAASPIAYAQQFRLSGHIEGQQSGVVHLYYANKDGGRVSDSATLVQGNFYFTGEIKEPTRASFSVGKPTGMNEKTSTSLYLEPTKMYLKGEVNDLKNAVITGSKTQNEFALFNKKISPILEEEKPLSAKYKMANEALMAAAKAKKDEATLTALTEKAAAIHEEFEPFNKRIDAISYQFFAAHPQSYFTASRLRFFVSKLPLDSLQMFYHNLGGKIQSSSYGKELKAEINKLKAGSPGSIAANFTTTDINGKAISLSDFKGKYVILDFWASWCVPCRHSNPHMIDLYKKYHAKGLEIIGVSDDDSKPEAWRKAVAKDGVGIWHNVLRGLDWNLRRANKPNPKDISEKYGIHSLPTKILIDKKGKIIGRFVGDDAAMDKMLLTVFKF